MCVRARERERESVRERAVLSSSSSSFFFLLQGHSYRHAL